jgi:pimeloyl-ACP methyl ester carboxylesterase
MQSALASRSGHRRRGVSILASALVLGGCAQPIPAEQPTTAATYAEAPCPVPNIPDVPELDLGADVVCGFLTVPENRAEPDGRKIKIAVARLEATSPDPGRAPMVYLNGGPGSSGIAIAEELRDKGINRDRDVIFVSQRGTLHADPLLTCAESDHVVAESRGLSMLAPSTAQRSLDAVRACHDRLASKGYDLSAYNTVENAADMADLRIAMAIDSWHVYGVSYGTDLALQLMRDHPEGISSVVLDSVVPPQNNLLTHLWGSAAGGFKAAFDACVAQPRCAGAYPDLENEFTTTVQRLAKNPMTVDVPASVDLPAQRVVLDGYKFANLVVLKSMDSNSFAALPQMIHATAVGDGRAAGVEVRNSVPSVDLMSYGLRYGVLCREAAPFTTPDAIAADAQKALPRFPAEVLAIQPQFGRMMDDCRVWNVGRADPNVNQPVQSDIPVLLLAGTFDAITQPSQADDAAATLRNGRVVRFPGIGHDVYMESDCGRAIVADFLSRPDSYDAGCVDTMRIPDFVT